MKDINQIQAYNNIGSNYLPVNERNKVVQENSGLSTRDWPVDIHFNKPDNFLPTYASKSCAYPTDTMQNKWGENRTTLKGADIGTKYGLQLSIEDQIAKIKYCKETGNSELAGKLIKNVSDLTMKQLQNGIITDSLMQKKYYISDGGLDGGSGLYSPSGDVEDVKAQLDKMSCGWRCNRLTRFVLNNRSSFNIELKNNGSYSGRFFSNPLEAFNNKGIMSCGETGGILHTKTPDTACGSVGYISFDVRTPGRNYTVICGFSTVYSGKNSAGIQVRCSDGVQDQLGKISGHGVDSTGGVTDIAALVYNYHSQNSNATIQKFYEASTIFRVNCQFDNESWSNFMFTIEDV